MMTSARYLTAGLLLWLLGISNFCLQPVSTGKSVIKIYEGTTPCSESVIEMLRLSRDIKCEMIRWKLALYKEQNKTSPMRFELSYTYGIGKQNTRGFTEGEQTQILKGECTSSAGIFQNLKAKVYNLVADSSHISLSFFQPDQNLLHLLTADKRLLVGTGAWSYTLNRKEPEKSINDKFIPKPFSQIGSNSETSVVGIFEGRSPCDKPMKDLHGITSSQCNLIKYQLTLFQDSISHTPTTFRLYTIYVGFGDDNKYSCTGTWKVLKGTVADPASIVYQLEPNQVRSQSPILLQKADDNILFFLDDNTNLLVGNEYCSYTLSRKIN